MKTTCISSLSSAIALSAIDIRPLLCILCLLSSFESVAGLNIYIYSGVEFVPDAPLDQDGYPSEGNHVRLEADKNFPEQFEGMKNGIYKYKKEFDYYLQYSGYGEFRCFLIKLRLIRGNSSLAGVRLLTLHHQIEQRFSNPLQAHSTLGLATALLSSEMTLQAPSFSGGASNVVEHIPFDDLISFNDHEGPIGPRACRRLRKDFIEYLELAKASNCEEYLIETFKFFFESLKNADVEDTVINLG